MPKYKEIQKQVFQWLKAKYDADNNFTFSLRQKANKGAELNYFIGTEKSKYFSTTFWYIPVAYPGSSSDLINLIFYVREGKVWFSIQFNTTRNPEGNQNIWDLELLLKIKPEIRRLFSPEVYNEAGTENKVEFFSVESPVRYNSLEAMVPDIESYLDKIIPVVDKKIEEVKAEHPAFHAGRYTKAEQEDMLAKMHSRFRKYEVLEEIESELDEEPTPEAVQAENLIAPTLNQILYGPPGTGKTYHTIDRALEILNPQFNLKQDREILKAEYKKYLDAGRIAFTTFHQSLSYEDFIEGIKPEVEEDTEGNRTVVYEVQPGIFKALADRANAPVLINQNIQADFDDAWDSLLKDFENNPKLFLKVQTPGKGYNIVEVTSNGNLLVKSSTAKNDTLVSYSRLKRLHSSIADLSHVRNIDREFRGVIGGMDSSAYWAVLNYIHSWLAAHESKLVTLEEKLPYILIIDEINRGNVSQIFGELITLIEDDKRIGRKEELKVILPYSKSIFGVPENLYIIGTMNTADRSVEAIDTALRRRFSFIETPPQPERLTDVNYKDVNLSELLATINVRIELLVDRDHQIGHAYFMGIENLEDLKLCFRNRILPLLEEYFYGDFGKIGLVLGDKFVKRKTIQNTKSVLANLKDYEEVSLLEDRPIFEYTKNVLEMDLNDFISIYGSPTIPA